MWPATVNELSDCSLWQATVNELSDCSLLLLNAELSQEISCHRPKSREEELASFECFINCERQSHKYVEAKSHKCGEKSHKCGRKVTQMWRQTHKDAEAVNKDVEAKSQRCGDKVTKQCPRTTACEEKREP